MEPLTAGQTVTYIDLDGTQHAATVIEAYAQGALVNVPDLPAGTQNVACKRLEFEASLGTAQGPCITDAAGGTDGSFENPIAAE